MQKYKFVVDCETLEQDIINAGTVVELISCNQEVNLEQGCNDVGIYIPCVHVENEDDEYVIPTVNFIVSTERLDKE